MWFIFNLQKEETYTIRYKFKQEIYYNFYLQRVPIWAGIAETGVYTNVRHLQAHVSDLLSHVSEHIPIQFGLVIIKVSPHGIHPNPLFQLKQNCNTHLILHMCGLNWGPAIYMSSWSDPYINIVIITCTFLHWIQFLMARFFGGCQRFSIRKINLEDIGSYVEVIGIIRYNYCGVCSDDQTF